MPERDVPRQGNGKAKEGRLSACSENVGFYFLDYVSVSDPNGTPSDEEDEGRMRMTATLARYWDGRDRAIERH